MIGRARVLVHHRAPAEGAEAIEQAYHEISTALEGTPGLLGNELLRSVRDPSAFAVLSEWKSLAAFQEWEQGSGHRGTTSPLRPYQDRERDPHFEIYEVTGSW